MSSVTLVPKERFPISKVSVLVDKITWTPSPLTSNKPEPKTSAFQIRLSEKFPNEVGVNDICIVSESNAPIVTEFWMSKGRDKFENVTICWELTELVKINSK